ncbi:MAG: glucose 1-dehydrogenase [Chloroflexi bacterium]|nr:glucose 1-dehydrogenase [Chloroflexota bacterium]MYI83664.1 glucose 1-dehydrogenase [Chloroflexota bacterium]
MGRLDGKTALITGGARGQGAAEAALFAEEGANVVLTDVLDEEGERTADIIGGTFLHHDVTSEEEWASVVSRTVGLHGGLDVLVNNAAIFSPSSLLETEPDEFRRVIEVNQVSVYLGMREVAPVMIERGGGSIVNISSGAGMRAGSSGFAYGASKWAVRGMTKSAAVRLGRHGIRVNSIHPGFVDTVMLGQTRIVQRGNLDAAVERIPLGRVGRPEEIARLALFLASDESAYSTGSEFIADGGSLA